jgi:site-specific recombinase XerC
MSVMMYGWYTMGLTITDAKVTEFGNWLARRGRSPVTIRAYRVCLLQCAKTRSLTDRLVGDVLAPKSKRLNKAALAAWAKYTKDGDLKNDLDDVRLPPPSRLRPKIPLVTADWQRLVRHVEAHDRMPVHEKACVLIMARRGLRVADVLRIERKHAQRALATGRFSYSAKGSKRIEISAAPIRAALESLVNAGKWTTVVDLFDVSGPTPEDTMKLCSQRVRRAIARCGKDLELDDVHPHRLRRSYATFFLQQHHGDPQAMVKLVEHMAWSGIAVAAGYVDGVSAADLDRIGAEMIDDLLEGP